jgi:hypothetical protein
MINSIVATILQPIKVRVVKNISPLVLHTNIVARDMLHITAHSNRTMLDKVNLFILCVLKVYKKQDFHLLVSCCEPQDLSAIIDRPYFKCLFVLVKSVKHLIFEGSFTRHY